MKLAASLIVLAVGAASPEMHYFRYERPIQNISAQAGQACLAIDEGIFAHAAPELADLRLFRGSTETPYVVRLATPAAAGERSIEVLNKGVRGGQTVFDAELPDAHYSDLTLDVTGQNFIATVTVTGSRNLNGGAETRIGAFTIFDLSQQRLGRSTVLHLPESDFRSLHFRIAGPLTPESITGLSVESLPDSPPRYVTVAESAAVTQKGRTSVLEFTVPAHVPVDRIVFTPGADPAFFSRNVVISVTPANPPAAAEGVEAPQPVVSSGNILRVHSVQAGQKIDEERLEMDTTRVDLDTDSKWTVTVENGDDVPVALNRVQLQMLERTLCFEATAQTGYTLYYGDPGLSAPRYDYATLFAPKADASHLTTGPEAQNPDFQARPDLRPFTEKHPALLWVALLAVIAALGLIAFRSVKRPAQPQP